MRFRPGALALSAAVVGLTPAGIAGYGGAIQDQRNPPGTAEQTRDSDATVTLLVRGMMKSRSGAT